MLVVYSHAYVTVYRLSFGRCFAVVRWVVAHNVWLSRKRKALEVTRMKRKMLRRKCHQQQQPPQQDWAPPPRTRPTTKMIR